ncbi:MAG: PTS sugar transporter subunit IIA [Planctomycetes bacterium]|nr:PTS sugar transporter subunit IIA [Planctomycetota bacterium]
MTHSTPQLACLLAITGLLMPGCHSPTLMPAEPLANQVNPAGGRTAFYDTNRDGQSDYAEQLGPDGRVAVLLFDTDHDGQLERRVVLDQLDHSKSRELLIILDSVPYHLVHVFWNEVLFRLFHPPSVIVSPFPAMTDLCLAEFFGVSPCPGVESRYFDGEHLTPGLLTYTLEGNAPWLEHVDAYIWPINHGYIYSAPEPSFLHELHAIEQVFFQSDEPTVCGYSVGASAMGALKGEAGHRQLLEYVDRFCQSIVQRTEGQVRITLMSDHGHNFAQSKPFSLHKELRAMGYRDGSSLRKPGDIVVPRYGPVTCAAIHTREPAKVAADVIKIAGVDLSFYREGDEIAVHSADGFARIARSGDRYRYVTQRGDPLQLLPILEQLREDVFARERVMSTGVGRGLALPHAQTTAASDTLLAFAVTKKPVDFGALDGDPVRLILLLVGPEKERVMHVRLLGRISRMMNEGDFRSRLLDADSEEEVLVVFRMAEEAYG